MKYIGSTLARALFVLAAMFGSGTSMANEIYRVSIDTTSLSGTDGYLDFLFLGLGNAAPAEVAISNFSGNTAQDSVSSGDVSGTLLSQLVIGNGASWNEFAQWAHFGGVFNFDLSLDAKAAIGAGTTLSIALLDENFGYLGVSGDILTFDIQPGGTSAISSDPAFASVGAVPVPEPSALVLIFTGLGIVMVARRRAAAR